MHQMSRELAAMLVKPNLARITEAPKVSRDWLAALLQNKRQNNTTNPKTITAASLLITEFALEYLQLNF